MMTGFLLDCTTVGNKRMTLPQAHFPLEVWMSVPSVVRSSLNGWRWTWTQGLQWTHSHWTLVQKERKMEDSIGLPVVNGFLMVELGNSQDTTKTDCSDLWMDDSLVYTKCCAVLQKARAKDDKISTSDMMVDTIDSKIGKGMNFHFEKLVNWHGKNEPIPVYRENNIFNFYLKREVKSTETNNVNDADHYLAKNCQQSGDGDGRAVRS